MSSNFKNVFGKFLSGPQKESKSDALFQIAERTSEIPVKYTGPRNVEKKSQEWMIDIQNWKRENKTKLKKIDFELRSIKENVGRDKQEIETLKKENESLKELFSEQQVLKDQAYQQVIKTERDVLQARDELCNVFEGFDSVYAYETKLKQLSTVEQIKYEDLLQILNTFEAKYKEKITTLETSLLENQTRKSDFEKRIQMENEKLKLLYTKLDEKKKLKIQLDKECSEIKQKISENVLEEEYLNKSLFERKTKLCELGNFLEGIQQKFEKTETQLNAQLENLNTLLSKKEMRLNYITSELCKLREKQLRFIKDREAFRKKSTEIDVLITERESTLMKLKEKMKESEARNFEQETKNAELMKKLERLKKLNESLNLKAIEASADIDSGKSEFEFKVDEKDKQIAMLTTRVEEAKQEREALKNKVENDELEVNKIAKELEMINKKIATIKETKKVENQTQNTNASLISHGNNKTHSSTRKQLNFNKDDFELYSMSSDTEDDSEKSPKQLLSSTKNYSKEKKKSSSKKTPKNDYEQWF